MPVNANMTNREVCDIKFQDFLTKKMFLDCDYANVTTSELTGETKYAYGGKGHPKRIACNGERGGTIKIETQIQPFKLYSLMTGAAIETTAKFIKREVHTTTAETPTITLEGTPAAGGYVNLFLATDDCGTLVPATLSGSTVTLGTPSANTYVVYYMEAISTNVKKLNIKTTTFPKAFTAFMETTDITEDGEILPFKMIAYKCQPQNNISIANSNNGEPATLTVTCDLLADGNNDIFDIILIEDPV